MPEYNFQAQEGLADYQHPRWGALWAGVFTFIGIWSVFGLLGAAIFTSAANQDTIIVNVMGMGIWAVLLTVIAMFVAGLTTSQLAQIENSGERVIHGMIMFGLTVATVLLIVGVSGIGGTAPGGARLYPLDPRNSWTLTLQTGVGWIGFVALFFGWLAAIGGASWRRRTGAEASVQQARHAA